MRTWETGINQTTTAVPQIQCPISKTNTNDGGGANVKLSIIKVALSAQRSTTIKKDAGLKRKKICKKAMGHVFFSFTIDHEPRRCRLILKLMRPSLWRVRFRRLTEN